MAVIKWLMIAFLTLELRIEGAQSLKDKRQVTRRPETTGSGLPSMWGLRNSTWPAAGIRATIGGRRRLALRATTLTG